MRTMTCERTTRYHRSVPNPATADKCVPTFGEKHVTLRRLMRSLVVLNTAQKLDGIPQNTKARETRDDGRRTLWPDSCSSVLVFSRALASYTADLPSRHPPGIYIGGSGRPHWHSHTPSPQCSPSHPPESTHNDLRVVERPSHPRHRRARARAPAPIRRLLLDLPRPARRIRLWPRAGTALRPCRRRARPRAPSVSPPA